MHHTIELVTETCHDARLYFLLMGLEASFVKGFASVGQFVSHRGLAHTKDPFVVNENEMVGAHRFFLSVSSGEDGRQSAIVHDVRSRGSQTARHNVFVGHLHEEKAPRESHGKTTPQKVHPNRNQKVRDHLRTQCPPQK